MTASLRDYTAGLVLANRKSSRVAENRNHLVRYALQQDADYILFLDSDMKFPPDTLKLLLAHDKDIVGGTYVKRSPPHAVLGVPLDANNAAFSSGISRVKGLPAGCLLIKTDVFRKLAQPWFMEPPIVIEGETELMGEDYYFCSAAGTAGYEIYVDVDLSHRLGHIGRGEYYIPAAMEAPVCVES